MIRILGVELRRFVWRRSFRFFGLLALAGIALAATIVFFTSGPPARSVPVTDGSNRQMMDECLRVVEAEGELPPGYTSAEEFCADMHVGSSEPADLRFHLTSLTDIFGGTSIPLIILGLALGASFIGAEWHAGTITPLLTWEPRRVAVFLGKVIAAMSGVFVSAIVIQTILGLVLWFVASVRGTTEGADLAWLGETALVGVRGALIAALMAVLGFAIAAVARNTTTALIIGFVYFAVGEALLRGLKPGWQPWLIGDNAAAFVIGPDEVFMMGDTRTVLTALLVVVGYAVVATAGAVAWFQSRDVTLPRTLVAMKVKLRNPDRTVEVSGPKTVASLLAELDIVPEAVLVIRDATLLTRDERVTDTDELEVRPVLSGGSGPEIRS